MTSCHTENLTGSTTASIATSTEAPRRRGGRPRTFDKKVSAISTIMTQFKIIGAWDDPKKLRGSCCDLLDACRRLERSVTAKTMVFAVPEKTFQAWLTAAGFNFRRGRCSERDIHFWTRSVPHIAGKFDAEVFTAISRPIKPHAL